MRRKNNHRVCLRVENRDRSRIDGWIGGGFGFKLMATEWETQLDKYTKVVAGWRASEVGGTENRGALGSI